MNQTASGVNFLSLSDTKLDVRELIRDAERCYPTFNFRHKVANIIFYQNRNDFSAYLWHEYEIRDIPGDWERGAHYVHQGKSIIGVELTESLTTSLLIYELGRAVEDYRLKLDGTVIEEGKERDGYHIWVAFFCQAHASWERKAHEQENDIFLNELPYLLEKRDEMFNKRNIDRTFLSLVYSMSDLFYYVEQGDDDGAHHYLDIFEHLTHKPFMELYDELFSYLRGYFHKNGTDYSHPHKATFFEVLEDYKEEFTDYFLKNQH